MSVLELAVRSTTDRVIDRLTAMTPGPVRDLLRTAVLSLRNSGQRTAGVLAVVAWAALSAAGRAGHPSALSRQSWQVAAQ